MSWYFLFFIFTVFSSFDPSIIHVDPVIIIMNLPMKIGNVIIINL
jgi:hypothetical protein